MDYCNTVCRVMAQNLGLIADIGEVREAYENVRNDENELNW